MRAASLAPQSPPPDTAAASPKKQTMQRSEQRDPPDGLAFDGYVPFLVLFGLEGMIRATLSAIVPIHAYEVLGSAVLVSIVYAANSVIGLFGSVLLPLLLHRMERRTAMSLGLGAGILCGLLLVLHTPVALVLALVLQIVMNIIFEGVMNVTLMERLPRRFIGTFEPKRLLISGAAFTIGPWLGVALDRRVMPNLTFYLVAALALSLLLIYWLHGPSAPNGSEAVKRDKPAPSPLRFIPRFIAQPRLVLAWLLAFGRSGWWIMFFIYTPIYVTRSGYPADLGGALVSLGLAPMLLMPVWARFARSHGLRPLLVGAFYAVGVTTIAAGLVSSYPIPTMILLVVGAWLATIIDAAGNTPFLRAVHPYERAAMTSVFLTFRHATSLVSPGLFAVTLWFFPFGGVFLVAGTLALGIGWLARHLPRTM